METAVWDCGGLWCFSMPELAEANSEGGVCMLGEVDSCIALLYGITHLRVP